jgi:hypothetical protein
MVDISTGKGFEPWLSGKAGRELLKPAPNDLLRKWPVSRRVNSSRASDDDPTLIEEITMASHSSYSNVRYAAHSRLMSDIARLPGWARKRHMRRSKNVSLFDYLVGGGEQRGRDGNSKGFSRLEIDHLHCI